MGQKVISQPRRTSPCRRWTVLTYRPRRCRTPTTTCNSHLQTASAVPSCRMWPGDTVKFTGPDAVPSPCPWDSIQLAELTGHRKTYQEIGQKEKERCRMAIKASIASKRLPWRHSRKHISGSETHAREHNWSREHRVKLCVLMARWAAEPSVTTGGPALADMLKPSPRALQLPWFSC